jgi:hypothetical protein
MTDVANGAPDAPAGWYPDTSMPGTQRYWTGTAWTNHVAPLAPIQPSAQSSAQRDAHDNGNGLFLIGFVCAIVMPVLGFIVGLILLGRRGEAGYGFFLWLLSGLSLYVWYSALQTGQFSA